LRGIRPTLVINTAEFTDVDACEDNVRKAFDVNACAVRTLAGTCTELGAALVHVSTDYVFDGEKRAPYREDDVPHPLSVYGVSKLAGEYFTRNGCPRHFVVRTSGLYGAASARGKGGNFVETMIRMAREGRPIRVVNDQVLTPTYAKDLAKTIERLIQTDAYGLYHVTNRGACSWYEFAGRIFTRMGIAPDFGPTTSAEWGARAPRPPYSVLANEKVVHIGGSELRVWTEALDAYLREKGYA
jgi:dTDP-4-dehydrorhamnose reductase